MRLRRLSRGQRYLGPPRARLRYSSLLTSAISSSCGATGPAPLHPASQQQQQQPAQEGSSNCFRTAAQQERGLCSGSNSTSSRGRRCPGASTTTEWESLRALVPMRAHAITAAAAAAAVRPPPQSEVALPQVEAALAAAAAVVTTHLAGRSRTGSSLRPRNLQLARGSTRGQTHSTRPH
jgi:hypothetical protein